MFFSVGQRSNGVLSISFPRNYVANDSYRVYWRTTSLSRSVLLLFLPTILRFVLFSVIFSLLKVDAKTRGTVIERASGAGAPERVAK